VCKGESESPFAFPAWPEIAEIGAEIEAISGGRKSAEIAAGSPEIEIVGMGKAAKCARAEIGKLGNRGQGVARLRLPMPGASLLCWVFTSVNRLRWVCVSVLGLSRASGRAETHILVLRVLVWWVVGLFTSVNRLPGVAHRFWGCFEHQDG